MMSSFYVLVLVLEERNQKQLHIFIAYILHLQLY